MGHTAGRPGTNGGDMGQAIFFQNNLITIVTKNNNQFQIYVFIEKLLFIPKDGVKDLNLVAQTFHMMG